MLSRVTKGTHFKLLTTRRAFGTNLPAAASQGELAHIKALELDNQRSITTEQMSEKFRGHRQRYLDERRDYFEMLNDTEARQ